MRNETRFVTRYRIMWLTLVTIFVGLMVLLTISYRAPRVAPADIKSAVKKQNPPPQTIQQIAGPLSAKMNDLDLSLSSSDGVLLMRLWAKEARKDGNRFEISEGAMQFVTETQNTLLLEVEDAIYTQDEGVARIAGSIKGVISGSEQYFEACNVEWDPAGSILKAGTVTFNSPVFEVVGSEMHINLLTGKIRFSGPVTAGL